MTTLLCYIVTRDEPELSRICHRQNTHDNPIGLIVRLNEITTPYTVIWTFACRWFLNIIMIDPVDTYCRQLR